MTLRIVVADDHPIFRSGLVRSLEEGGFEVVGEGGDADAAVELARAHAPDLALLDISMPGDGIEAARRIRAEAPSVRVAMLTVSEDVSNVARALEAGAIGYVLKGVSAADLRAVVAGIARGEAHVSPGLAARVLMTMRRPRPRDRRPIDDLTRREEDILRRVATGMSNREVAGGLGITEKTVKHHMTAILEKLQARNRVEATLIARDAWDAGEGPDAPGGIGPVSGRRDP